MNYPINTFPFRKGNRLISFFFSQPASVGLYSTNGGEALVITTNQRSHLEAIPEAFRNNILILDGGGFSPSTATGLSVISRDDIGRLVSGIKEETGATSLIVPASLARYMSWADGIEKDGMIIHVFSNNPREWETKSDKYRKYKSFHPLWIDRMFGISRLYIGQALIMSVPLMIFGVKSFVGGQLSLLIASTIIFLTWPLLPSRKNMIKGVIVGGMSVLALFLTDLFLNYGNLNMMSLAMGLFVSACWMGIVLNGTQP